MYIGIAFTVPEWDDICDVLIPCKHANLICI